MTLYRHYSRLPFIVSVALICGYNVLSSALLSSPASETQPREILIERAPGHTAVQLASAAPTEPAIGLETPSRPDR